jgi:hypothetical protein
LANYKEKTMIEKTTSVIALMPSTKNQIKSFVHKTVTELKDGYTNPLAYYVQLKAVETTIKDLLANKEVREMVSMEAKKYGKTFDLQGVKIEYSENISPKYDYTVCGDIEWDEMQVQLKELQEKIKLRETFLKSIPANATIMDENGVKLFPPTKTASEGIKVTLK